MRGNDSSTPAWDTTVCVECGQIAEIEWRAVLESTDGPIEHAYVRCVNRHWFLMPSGGLTTHAASDRVRPTSGRELRESPGS